MRGEHAVIHRRTHRAKGQSPDGQWVEASWAIEDLPLEDLRRIAIFHGQNAVVRIEKGRPAQLVPFFDDLPIFAGSSDELIEMLKEQSIIVEPMDWKRLWQLVITLGDGKLELPSLKPPPDYREHRQAEQDNPDSLRHLFHLHLKAIEGSALHWDLARAVITQAMRWKHPELGNRHTLFDLREETDLELPLEATQLEFGIYKDYPC